MKTEGLNAIIQPWTQCQHQSILKDVVAKDYGIIMSGEIGENMRKVKDDLAKILASSICQGVFKGRSAEEIEEFIRGNIDAVLSLYGEKTYN